MLRRVSRRVGAIRLRAAGAEQHVERDARVADHRQRLVRRRPADRVGVGARVVVGAAAGLVEVLDAELHRRERRGLAELLRVHLIERRAGPDVGALRLLRMRLRQEHRARAEVVAADFRRGERLGHAHVGVADDRHVVAIRLERRQRVVGHDREVRAGLRRREQVLARAPLVAAGEAVHFLDADQPRAVRGRRRLRAGARPAPSRPGTAAPPWRPSPRRNVRRGMCFPVMKCIGRVSSIGTRLSLYRSVRRLSGSTRLIRNASLLTTPRMNDDIL